MAMTPLVRNSEYDSAITKNNRLQSGCIFLLSTDFSSNSDWVSSLIHLHSRDSISSFLPPRPTASSPRGSDWPPASSAAGFPFQLAHVFQFCG